MTIALGVSRGLSNIDPGESNRLVLVRDVHPAGDMLVSARRARRVPTAQLVAFFSAGFSRSLKARSRRSNPFLAPNSPLKSPGVTCSNFDFFRTPFLGFQTFLVVALVLAVFCSAIQKKGGAFFFCGSARIFRPLRSYWRSWTLYQGLHLTMSWKQGHRESLVYAVGSQCSVAQPGRVSPRAALPLTVPRSGNPAPLFCNHKL